MVRPAAASIVPIDVPCDGPSGVTVVAGQGGLPIPVKRVFFLGVVPADATRGDHAHRRCHQLFVPVEGTWQVEVDDGAEPIAWTLGARQHGLWVPPMNWVKVTNRSWGGAWLAVLASEAFNAADYMRDREAWLREVRG